MRQLSRAVGGRRGSAQGLGVASVQVAHQPWIGGFCVGGRIPVVRVIAEVLSGDKFARIAELQVAELGPNVAPVSREQVPAGRVMGTLGWFDT